MSTIQVVMIGTSAGAVGTEYNCDLLAEEVAKVGSILALTSSIASNNNYLYWLCTRLTPGRW